MVKTSMANTHPQTLAKEYQGDAKLIIAGTNKKLDWKCSTCEHEWKQSGCSRVQGSGCPACANGRFIVMVETLCLTPTQI
jgi:Zn finger protein HypA/HybF involved in hydrogenase expression